MDITLPRLRNYSVAVKEWNDEIIFVRQVTPGASERSFGIQVARLAGLPDTVVSRAKTILSTLEKGDDQAAHAEAPPVPPAKGQAPSEPKPKPKPKSKRKPEPPSSEPVDETKPKPEQPAEPASPASPDSTHVGGVQMELF